MTNELQIFCSLPKCEKDADTECINCEYMVREEPKKRMTNEEAKEELLDMKRDVVADSWRDKALNLAIKVLEQISHLKDRPCEACEFYTGEGCSKWECVFEGSDAE